MMFMLLGVIVLLALSPFLGTSVSDKFGPNVTEVYNLFCTFESIPFSVEDVISNATGEKVTRLDIIIGIGFPLNYYTYNASQEKFADMGWLHSNQAEFLAYSSEKLENGTNYVVDYGRTIALHVYGYPDITISAIGIERIHKENWFEHLLYRNWLFIFLVSLILVFVCSLFTLPFIEYYINSKAGKSKKQGEKLIANAQTASTKV
jgi:hypothetical protein